MNKSARIKSIVFLIAAVAYIPFTSFANDTLNSAIAAFERKEYQTAWQVFQSLAKQGEVTSQRYLGEMYDKGYGVSQDYQKAVNWYRKAAESGDVAAQFYLGVKYANGHGVPEDPTQAYVWFAISFNNGFQRAADPLRVLNKSMSLSQRQIALDLAQKKMIELRIH